MRCDACRILAQDLAKGDLTVDEELVVQEHLDKCERCRAYYEGCLNKHRYDARSPEGESDAGAAPLDPVKQNSSPRWLAPALIAAAILVVALSGLKLLASHKGARWLGGGRHACTHALHGVRH